MCKLIQSKAALGKLRFFPLNSSQVSQSTVIDRQCTKKSITEVTPFWEPCFSDHKFQQTVWCSEFYPFVYRRNMRQSLWIFKDSWRLKTRVKPIFFMHWLKFVKRLQLRGVYDTVIKLFLAIACYYKAILLFTKQKYF